MKIPADDALEEPVEEPKERSQQAVDQPFERIGGGPVRTQQHRRQRRAERQRIHRRQNGRHGDRQSELPEEEPGDAADEPTGHKHCGEYGRHTDHRAGDLVHRLSGRLARGESLCDPPLDVLYHHDRIVDHDTDREHEAKE